MHYNYKLDEEAIINITKNKIKDIELQKQIKLIFYYTQCTTSNLIINENTNSAKIHLKQINVLDKFTSPFRKCLPKSQNNSYFGYTTTTFSHCLKNHLSGNSAIKQYLIIKHSNITNQLTSLEVRKILTDNIIIINKTIIKKNDYKS